MRRTDREWLADAEDHLTAVLAYLSLRESNAELVLDGAAMRFSSALDSIGKVSEPVRLRAFDAEEWRAMRGMRNRIAHGYGIADRTLLRQVFEEQTEGVRRKLRQLSAELAE